MTNPLFPLLFRHARWAGLAGLAAAAATGTLQQQAEKALLDNDPEAAATPATPRTFAWSDFDADGKPDAAVIGAGGRVRLLRNLGDGGFEEITEVAGLDVTGASLLLWGDFDGDSDADLYVGTQAGPSHLFRNEAGLFTDVAELVGLTHVASDVSARWLDWDGDGRQDLHVTTTTGNLLYHSLGEVFAATELAGPVAPLALGGLLPDALPGGESSQPAASGRLEVTGRKGQGFQGTAPTAALGTTPLTLDPTRITGTTGCVPSLLDLALPGNCLNASSVPSLGSLYPLSSDFFVDAVTGNVGLGTTSPTQELTLFGSNDIRVRVESFDQSAGVQFQSGATGQVDISSPGGSDDLRFHLGGSNRMVITDGGRVGIGVLGPNRTLEVRGLIQSSSTGSAGFEMLSDLTGLVSVFSPTGTDDLHINAGGSTRLSVGASGLVSVKESLEIRGGADIVERFESSCGALEPGTVVVIDPENPGQLSCSFDAYDTKVAGVVSGAGGVKPGLCLSQDGVLDGELPVAMTGRVYVKCSTENGAVRPGDRLTTAALAGYAMKVTDESRSIGTVIGKAMSSLDEGTGLVLVLVNLQ